MHGQVSSVLAQSLALPSGVMRKSEQQELEAADHTMPTVKKQSAGAQLFQTVQDHHHHQRRHSQWLGLPPHLAYSGMHRGLTPLGLIKWTVKINHHTGRGPTHL